MQRLESLLHSSLFRLETANLRLPPNVAGMHDPNWTLLLKEAKEWDCIIALYKDKFAMLTGMFLKLQTQPSQASAQGVPVLEVGSARYASAGSCWAGTALIVLPSIRARALFWVHQSDASATGRGRFLRPLLCNRCWLVATLSTSSSRGRDRLCNWRRNTGWYLMPPVAAGA